VITPTYINVGLVTIGDTYVQKVTLFNTGTGLLDVPSIVSDDPDFTPDAGSMQILFNNWDSLYVTFEPLAPGVDTATVTFTSNGPTSPLTLVLVGEGTHTVGVGDDIPLAFSLGQNMPNPFAGTTMIRYALPVRSRVELDVFDLQGKRVARLAEGEQEAGHYSVPFGAGARTLEGRLQGVRSGVYFYRLRAGSFLATRKMLLLH
jgi:hypothetical protein